MYTHWLTNTEGEDQGGKTLAAYYRKESSDVVKVVEAENKPPLPIYNFKDTRVSRDGPNPHFLSKNRKKGPDETFLSGNVIYTQNVNGISGKEKHLESLLDPLVDIMISKEITPYCVQETWVVRNTIIMVRVHMIFYIIDVRGKTKPKEGTLEVSL